MIVAGFRVFVILLVLHSSALAASTAGVELCKQNKFMFGEAKRLYGSGQMLLSAMHFSGLRVSDCDSEMASKSWLGYSLALNHLQENNEALLAIESGLRGPNVTERDKVALRMVKTWILQSPDSELSVKQKVDWRLWTARLDRPTYLSELEKANLTESEKRRLADLELSLVTAPQKSVWGSGIASAILPGSGQAYVGNWQAAMLSFVINAIFLGATLEFYQKGLPAAAVASGTIFSITYLGNIVSAAQGASEANRLARGGFDSEIRSELLPELSF
jgi:hypothetical protein